MQTSEVLYGAADHLEHLGWAQGCASMLVSGPHCIQGAVQAAQEGPTVDVGLGMQYHYFDAAPSAAGTALMDYLGCDATGVWQWNDAQGRTASEVIEVLRAAALIEAAKENAETRERVSA